MLAYSEKPCGNSEVSSSNHKLAVPRKAKDNLPLQKYCVLTTLTAATARLQLIYLRIAYAIASVMLSIMTSLLQFHLAEEKSIKTIIVPPMLAATNSYAHCTKRYVLQANL